MPAIVNAGPTGQVIAAADTAHAVTAAGTSRTSTAGSGADDTVQTRTSGRSFSSRAGPMPSTSAS